MSANIIPNKKLHDHIASLFKRGVSIADLAREFGMTTDKIEDLLRPYCHPGGGD